MPHALAFLDSLGGPEILVIGEIALLMFGSKRLPEVGRGLGRAIREFKRATSGVEDNLREIMRDEPTPRIRPPLRQGPPRNPANPFTQPAAETETPALESGSPAPVEKPSAANPANHNAPGQLSFGENFDSAQHGATPHDTSPQSNPGLSHSHDGGAGDPHSGTDVPPHS